jgi:Fur family iron response transcriptional regulator
MVQRLRNAGLQPTRQRLAVAAVILAKPTHLTADEVLKLLLALSSHAPAAIKKEVSGAGCGASGLTPISRATVYATLAQFARAGLLRELHTGGGAVVYDSNPTLHPHWMDVDSGQVHDLPPEVTLRVDGLDQLPTGLQIEDVQLMLRVRRA